MDIREYFDGLKLCLIIEPIVESVEISKYNFHWQDAAGNLIRRWGNAPHHPELDNYPHHVHTKDTVSTSSEIGIRTVLSVVKSGLNQ